MKDLQSQLMFRSTCLTSLLFLTYLVHQAVIFRFISFALCIGTRIYMYLTIPWFRTEDFLKELKTRQ